MGAGPVGNGSTPAFLIDMKVIWRRASQKHPHGLAQVMDIAHPTSGTAMTASGGFLLFDSLMTLVMRERPDVGQFSLFGHDLWQGWVMIAFTFITIFPPLPLGWLKTKPTKLLHTETLFADASMDRANWITGETE